MPETTSKAGDKAFLKGLTKKQNKRRKRDLAAIHTAKRKLSLSDGEYRDLLEAWTGRRSAKYMRAGERGEVIDNFRAMGFEKRGAKGEAKAARERRALPPDAADTSAVEQRVHTKIVGLWLKLYQAGKTDDASMAALCSFCARQTGIQHVRWLPGKEAETVIESLKKWIQR